MREWVKGAPLLLASAMLIVAGGVRLAFTEDDTPQHLLVGLSVLSVGLVAFGAWLAEHLIDRRKDHEDDR